MREDVQARIALTRSRTVNYVWPRIKAVIPGGGELLQIEGATHLHPALKFLDAMAGIDHLIFQNPIGIGLASRVQNPCPFSTSTVRYELYSGNMTEYARHLKQLSAQGAIKPLYWSHAYMSKQGTLDRVAVTKVADLIASVGDTALGWFPPPAPDGNRFWATEWKKFRDSGAWIWEWNRGVWTPPATTKPTQGKLWD